jgi:hypothetical protein
MKNDLISSSITRFLSYNRDQEFFHSNNRVGYDRRLCEHHCLSGVNSALINSRSALQKIISWIWFMTIILATQEAEIRRMLVQSQLGQKVHETLSRKYPIQKRTGRVAQVAEHLPVKHEALS